MKKGTAVPGPKELARIAQEPLGLTTIKIPELKTGLLTITLQGVTPLIVHKFSTKTKEQIISKQKGEARQKREAKVPQEECEACLYVIPSSNGKPHYGFPASGFKKAAVSACRYVDDINMTFAKGCFHVIGDLLEIEGEGWTMREDPVRLNSGPRPVADIRFRPEFKTWRVKVPIRYNASVVTPSIITNLFNVAGFSVGIGEWRPEKNGSFGMFEVSRQDQAEVEE